MLSGWTCCTGFTLKSSQKLVAFSASALGLLLSCNAKIVTPHTNVMFPIKNSLNKTKTMQVSLPFPLDIAFLFLSGQFLTLFSFPWNWQLPLPICHFTQTALEIISFTWQSGCMSLQGGGGHKLQYAGCLVSVPVSEGFFCCNVAFLQTTCQSSGILLHCSGRAKCHWVRGLNRLWGSAAMAEWGSWRPWLKIWYPEVLVTLCSTTTTAFQI